MSVQEQNVDPQLDAAFTLPASFADDPEYSELYNTIVNRLRMESAGLPMTTVQTLMLERIANLYVNIKHKERNEGFASLREQKEISDFWLKTTAEFHKVLNAGHDKLREKLLIDVEGIIVQSLVEIKDPEERKKVKLAMATGLANIGL